MTAPTIPSAPAGAAAAPVDPTLLNDGEGDGFDALNTPNTDAPAPVGSIADASRALREAKEPTEATVSEQPRNPDGTFAPKEPKTEEAVEAEAPEAPEAPALDAESPETDDQADAEGESAEPKVFVLKGEAQRGESDLELDVTGLPPEAVERLERNQKQGMRRAEFDHEMRKVRADRANLDAVETELAVDPEGFLLARVAPAKRLAVGQAILLDQFEELAPMIEALWNNPDARYQRLNDLRASLEGRKGEVVASVQAARQAAEVRAAVQELIPESANDSEAQEFFATSIALLQQRAMQNQSVTGPEVPALLAAHRRRFFGASDPAPVPPSRPKLAVKKTPNPPAPTAPTTVLPADEVARRAKARQAALATAPKGAGVGAVQREPGPANETIEQRSRRLRAGQ